jgi:hypothetical protein
MLSAGAGLTVTSREEAGSSLLSFLFLKQEAHPNFFREALWRRLIGHLSLVLCINYA